VNSFMPTHVYTYTIQVYSTEEDTYLRSLSLYPPFSMVANGKALVTFTVLYSFAV
jgi:hypothetical protein